MFSGLSLTRHLHSRVGDDDDSSTRIRAQNPSVEGGLPGSISEANEDVSSSFDEVSSKRPQDGRIEHVELHKEVPESFVSYALSVLLGRALPDARDGLKPVHRRIL